MPQARPARAGDPCQAIETPGPAPRLGGSVCARRWGTSP
jgi:hypothetical protein